MNNSRNSFVWIIVVILIIAGGIFFFSRNMPILSDTNGTATTTDTNTTPPASLTSFQSSDLGFSFSYPKTFSLVPQNFADTANRRTLVTLSNADKSVTISVQTFLDPATGKPLPPYVGNYEKTAIANTIFDGSGANPKSFAEFQLRTFGDARFAYIRTGVFEGVLGADYYAAAPGGIVRFTLVSQGVDWTNPAFDPEQDPGHIALKNILATIRIGAYQASSPAVTYVAYADPAGAYSANVPSGWTLKKNFAYDAIGPGKSIPGVSFAIPAPFTSATNLSTDSYISIEKNPYAKSCVAAEFTSTASTNPEATGSGINSISWNVGESSDVAAGNLYNERVYAAKSGTDCYGIRLFLHSGQIGNYDSGARQEFDKAVLVKIQDAVAASFKFLK